MSSLFSCIRGDKPKKQKMTSSLPQTYRALIAKEDDNHPARLQDLPLPKPGKDQVLVKMAFASLNPVDIRTMNGGLRFGPNPPYPVGLEGSGTVIAVGEDLKKPYKVGDRVYVYNPGTLAQYNLAQSENCALMKEDVSFEEGAYHIINPSTVAYMAALTERGGHKAVISSVASSSVGKMAIRLFKQKGIKTINIVRQDKYIDELKREGADYVLNSESPDFEAQLKEIAAKEQATIAFDPINGDFTAKISKCQPPNSICYAYGMLSGQVTWSIPEKKMLDDGKAITGFVSTHYVNEFKNKGELDKLFKELHTSLKTIYKIHINRTFSLEEIFDAMEYYNKNNSKGKILIKLN